MSQMTEFNHETSYDPSFWDCSLGNKNSLGTFPNSQLSDDKGKNMAYIYNEFLKNEIDFSESPDCFRRKREDNFFDCCQPMSYDLEIFGTKSNRRQYDLIRLEQEFDLSIPAENKLSLPTNNIENFESIDYSNLSRIPEKKPIMATFDDKIPEQNSFPEIQQNKSLPAVQLPTYNMASLQERSNATKELEPQYQPINEPQLATKYFEEICRKSILNLPMLPIKTKSNELGVSAGTTSTQECFSFLAANINMNQPFIMQRKTSFQDGQSTKAPSQSSLESPESIKKWAEVSSNLHNEVFQNAGTESQAKSKKKGGKKKLKTSPNEDMELKSNGSQQIKTELSSNRLKQEYSSHQLKQEVSSHQLKQEYSTNNKNGTRLSVENSAKIEEAIKYEEIMRIKSENADNRARINYDNLNSNLNPIQNNGIMNNQMMNRNIAPNQMGNYAKPLRFNPNGSNPSQQPGYYQNVHPSSMNESNNYQNDGYGNQRGLTHERSAGTKDPHENMKINNPNSGQPFNQHGVLPISNQFKFNNQELHSQFSDSNPNNNDNTNSSKQPQQYTQQQYPQQVFQQQQQSSQLQQSQQQQGPHYPQQSQKLQQNYPQQPIQNQQLQQQYTQQMRQQYPQQQQHLASQQQYPQQSKQRVLQPMQQSHYPQQIPQPQSSQQASQQHYPQQPLQQQQQQQQKTQPESNQHPPQNQQVPQLQSHHQQQQYPAQYQQPQRQLQQQQQMPMKQQQQLPMKQQQQQMMQKFPQNQQPGQQNPSQQSQQQAHNLNPQQVQQSSSQLPPNQISHQQQASQQMSQSHYNQKMQMQPIQQTQQLGPNHQIQKAPSQMNSQMQQIHQPSQHPNQRISQQMNQIRDAPQAQPNNPTANTNSVKQPPKWTDPKNTMPIPNVNSQMFNEAVATFLSKNNSKDLFKNLPMTAEVEKALMKSNILEKIQNSHKRKIGALSYEERRAKVEKYLEKRKQRSWDKKVNYQSRKKVASNRLRVQGRFVKGGSATKENADNSGGQVQEPIPDEIKAFADGNNISSNNDAIESDFNKLLGSPFKEFNLEEEKGFMYNNEFDFRGESFFD